MKWSFFLVSFLVSSMANGVANDNVKALRMALDDEYKAEATYLKVIDDFGNVRPFSNIVRSEQRHIQALIPFFSKYGVEVPENPYIGQVPSYQSVKQACHAGVDGEVDNVALYDRIFSLADDAELIQVFKSLQWASEYRHLPAFERCASRR